MREVDSLDEKPVSIDLFWPQENLNAIDTENFAADSLFFSFAFQGIGSLDRSGGEMRDQKFCIGKRLGEFLFFCR